MALDHPAHDRVYIALAEAEGLRLVTADSTLVRTALGRYAGRVLGLTDAATGPMNCNAKGPPIGVFSPFL